VSSSSLRVQTSIIPSRGSSWSLCDSRFSVKCRLPASTNRLTFLSRFSTGDVLQFALTLEHSRSTKPSLPISLVVVGDDVSVTRTQGTIVGRRGLAGTVLVHKLAGAMAERGDDLDSITARLDGIVGQIGTCGVGLGHCSVPGSGGGNEDDDKEQAHLVADHVEIGMGIHNEPGVLTIPLAKASELVPRLLEYITSTSDKERSYVPFQHDGKDEVILLVNNLGGISEVELGLVAREAMTTLQSQGIRVRRVGTGKYMVRPS
jgi:dihydroxyacetone kinase